MATWVAAPIATGVQQAAIPITTILPRTGAGFPLQDGLHGNSAWKPAPRASSLVNNTTGVAI